MREDKSRVLTLVFTDLVDSTALKTARGDVAVGELISRHREHVTRLAGECAGRVIDWAGDGCFLTFETSSAAVMFALRMQQVHAEESDLPRVRVGMHMGEVTEKPGPDGEAGHPRIEGLAVDIAARISGLAKPGQVLMSASVYNSARQRLGVETFGQPILWKAHGTYELKGFDEPLDIREAGLEGLSPLLAPDASEKARPVDSAAAAKTRVSATTEQRSLLPAVMVAAIVLLGLAVVYLFATRQGAPGDQAVAPPELGEGARTITSLAVLPLDNMSGDPQQDYFADSMTEAITAELAKIKALTVRGRTSAMQYKDSKLSIREIAAALNVDGLIEGSVLRDGDDVRVTVQLVHGPSDAHMWSESYTNTMESVLQLQSQVALAIADAISIELTGDERERIATERTVDPEAYEAFVLGVHFLKARTSEAFEQARVQFERTTQIDPGFAEAWARLGDVYRIGVITGGREVSEGIPIARNAYLRALGLDDTLALAHTGLAFIAFAHDGEWAQAEERFLHALDLSPNDTDTHTDYATYLAVVGRAAESIEHALTAIDLDPNDAEELVDAASILTISGESARARAIFEQVLKRSPNYSNAMREATYAYLNLRMHDEAIALSERAVELENRSNISLLVLSEALAEAGQSARAQGLLREVQDSGQHFDRGAMARVYLFMGDLDSTFEWADKAVEARDWWAVWLRRDPRLSRGAPDPNYERFFADPRYWSLIERMGFPPLPPEHPGYADEQAWLARKAAAEEASAPIRKIAVLPLSNLMNDPEQDYFVDGMMEAITAELSKISSLKVISRTSAMHYKDTELSMPEIAAELDVQGLIEGSVLRQGNDVRITVQLIDGRADTHLWANSYEGTLEDIFRLHSDVALAIAEEIRAVLSPEERSRIAHAPKVDPEAYELYLRGLETYFDGSVAGSMRAIRYFEDALEIEPDFALAWARKSMAHFGMTTLVPPAAAVQSRLSEEAADKAIALAPDDARAYFGKFQAELFFSLDWYASKATTDRAYELNPNLAETNMALATLEACRGDFTEAEKYFERAYALDSRSTFIAPVTGVWLTYVGSRERGTEILEQFIADNPDFALAQLFYFFALAGGEHYDEAFEALERFERLSGARAVSNILRAVVLADSGRLEEARTLEREFLSTGALSAMPPSFVAVYYASVGDIDKAFDYFEQAMESPTVLTTGMLRLESFSPGGSLGNLDKITKYDRYWELTDRMKFPPFPEGHPGHDRQQAWLQKKAASEEASAPIRKIAVLPLSNLMNDPEQDYFVDGMMEAITAELSKISSLKVISRTTAMHYKATELSMPEIAAELDVQGLIEGSVLRQGNDVRITVQLIDGRADTHLWANTYEGTLEDIFRLHSDVALAIAEEIRAVVSPEEQSRIANAPKVDPEAYDLYLRGMETYFDGSLPGAMRAIRYFEDALEIEPDFALAWSAKSTAHFSILVWTPPAYAVQSRLAKEAADKAIALAPEEARAYFPRFQLEFFSLDWYAAKATADRAYDLNSNLAEIALALGQLEAARGNFVEAERYLERAYALDSRSTFIAPHAGTWLMTVGRQARGAQILERFAADNPDFPLAHAYIGMALVGAERYDEALEAFEQLDRLVGASLFSKIFRATILAWTGSPEEARSLGREILSGSAPTDMPLSIVAVYYASVGEIDKSFDYFELAMESSDVGFVPVFRTALFTSGWSSIGRGELPDYDRYWELTDRMNFPPFPEGHPGYDRQQAWLARKAAAEQADAAIENHVSEPGVETSND